MTLLQLKSFYETAKYHNISKAAEQLYISRQAISRNIRLLEEEWGFPLFVREQKGVKLTESGEILYKSLGPLYSQFSSALTKAKEVAKVEKNNLCIGICEHINIIIFADKMLGKFCEKNSDSNINFDIMPPQTLVNGMLSGKLDVIFCPEFELNEMLDMFAYKRLKIMKMGIVLAKNHYLASTEILKINDLKDEMFYIFSGRYSKILENRVLRYCRQAGFMPKEIKYVDNVRSMEAALCSGKGVAITYYDSFRNTEKNLKHFPIDMPEHDYMDVVWRKDAKGIVSQLIMLLEEESEIKE